MRKVITEFQQGIDNQPVLNRKYTLTHSDKTGERFLYVGDRFREDRFCKVRDEVVGEWRLSNDIYSLWLICQLDCEASNYTSQERLEIFKGHIPRVAQIVNFGDADYIRNNDLQGSEL